MNCSSCGSSNVIEKMIEGYQVYECQTCEELHGDPDAIKAIEEKREALARYYRPESVSYL